MQAAISLAFAAGALAAFNPCGLALLPAYLTTFLDYRTDQYPLRRGLTVGAAVTSGFVAVFGVFGLLISLIALRLGTWLSVVTVALGVVLVVAGVLTLVRGSITLRLPRANLAVSGSLGGMFSYGVVYATVSLSCTLPVFMAAVSTSFRNEGNLLQGAAAYLAYALGMGVVLTTLVLAVALFQDRATAWIRRANPYFRYVSGAFLILAGLYVTWYGWVEYRTFQGDVVTTGPTAWVAQASSTLSGWVSSIPALALLASVIIAVGAVVALSRRSQPTDLPHQDRAELREHP